MDTEIRVSTESRPWRKKFSHRSSRDSNPQPFNLKSGALTTELSPQPLTCGSSSMLLTCLPQLPTPLPYKAGAASRTGSRRVTTTRRQCRGTIWRPFKRTQPPTTWHSNHRGEPSSHQSYHASLERRIAATRMSSSRKQSASSATTGWRTAQL